MAPPSLNPQPMGNGQPQQSLPNMGSPFAQNPSQQTNPFMGSGNTNNASKSPFEGAGFNNPFGGEHGAAGNPFGGGGTGGGVKGLIDSNNKLIQALNKLTTILEKMTQGRGMGGGDALGAFGRGGGGGAGTVLGSDALAMSQLRRLGSRSGGQVATPFTDAFQATQANFDEAGRDLNRTHIGGMFGGGTGYFGVGGRDYNADLNQYMAQRDRFINQGVEAFNYGRQPQPAIGPQLPPEMRRLDPNIMNENGQPIFQPENAQQADALQNQFNYGIRQGEIDQQFEQAAQNQPGFFRRNAGRAANIAGGAVNAFAQIGAAQDLPQMLSQIPYVGGLLAAPVSALQTRINDAATLEPIARLVAQQGSVAQQGNLYKTHQTLFDQFKKLGLDPGAALNEALQMQEAFGMAGGVDPSAPLGGTVGPTLSDLVGLGYTGNTIGTFLRLGRKDRPLNFSTAGGGTGNLFSYVAGLGLGDQGAMEFASALEGLQQMVPGMGYRVDNERARQAVISQVAKNTNHGFAAAAGVQQAQRQIQGTAEMGGGLKGIFGGLGDTLTMASFLGQYGDPIKAIRAFEGGYAYNPAALKGRLTGEFGADITEMGYLSRMTSADYDNIGSEGFKIGVSGLSVQNQDIIFSKKQIESKLTRGDDLYTNRQTEALKLIEINDKIEKHLVDGINVKGLDDLTDLLIGISDMLRNAIDVGLIGAGPIIKVLKLLLGIP